MSARLMKRTALVTGSCGLIGSEVCIHLSRNGYHIVGLDNNERAVFFGPEGDTRWSLNRLRSSIPGYVHYDLDIRDREAVLRLVDDILPQVTVHTAAQPSHDRAAAIPFDDFDTNAVGTLNFLEAVRRACPESPFVHMSTNKVYGDRPNTIRLRELETRWDYDDSEYENGIPESLSIDQSKHSVFGASKVAADVMVQEYGRYFNMPTCCLRGGCLTGSQPLRRGTAWLFELPGALQCRRARIQSLRLQRQAGAGQHSFRRRGELYARVLLPPRGLRRCTTSAAERIIPVRFWRPFRWSRSLPARSSKYTYVDQNRIGDHICYYSDLRKMKEHYPDWTITRPLRRCIQRDRRFLARTLASG